MDSDSFFYIFLKYEDRFIAIPFRVSDHIVRGEVKYNLTLRKTESYLKDVGAIVFRSNYEGLGFDPLEFYNQIILSIKQKKLSEVPIFILDGLDMYHPYRRDEAISCKEYFEIEFKSFGKEPKEHGLFFEVFDDDEEVTTDQLEKTLKHGNDYNKRKYKINKTVEQYIKASFDSSKLTSSHDRSNRWAPLLILKYLNHLNKNDIELGEEIDRLEDDISEDLYFKKKLYELSRLSSQVVETSLVKKLKSKRHDFLHLIKGKKVRILIVEDELSAGWRTAYEYLLPNDTCRLIFSESSSEASEKFNKDQKNIDLVILDIRLGEISEGEFDGSDVNELSGVKLAKQFRKIDKTIPILAATASNKSWTLESLLNKGINNYWVKISPDGLVDQGDSLESMISFYEKITKTMKWSLEIKPLINDFYSICDVFKDNNLVSQSVNKKSKSFHVLMHQTFDGFNKDILDGLQINIGYITFYSLINDFISYFSVPKKINENEEEFRVKDKSYLLFTKAIFDNKNPQYSYNEDLCHHQDRRSDKVLNDSMVFRGILDQIKPELGIEFMKLKEKRNKSPLTHGKTFDDNYSDVTLEDMTRLSRFFKNILDINSDT
jgi:CheY-like chemotaxis protein